MRIRALTIGLFAAAGVATGASAAPVVFTWDPGAVGLPGAGSITADNMTVSDFASATINPITHNFTEVGALKFTLFQLGGSTAASPGLNSTYSLYLTFSATGNQGGAIPTPGHTISGPITSLTYTLWGNPHGNPTFTVTNGAVTIGNNAGAIALATGTGGGTFDDFVTLTNTGGIFVPSAQALASLDPCLGAGGACTGNESAFFVSPVPTAMMDLEAAFTNTRGTASLVAGLPTFLNIRGGGGNLDVLVPEPATLGILGLGLLGLGLVRRKRD